MRELQRNFANCTMTCHDTKNLSGQLPAAIYLRACDCSARLKQTALQPQEMAARPLVALGRADQNKKAGMQKINVRKKYNIFWHLTLFESCLIDENQIVALSLSPSVSV